MHVGYSAGKGRGDRMKHDLVVVDIDTARLNEMMVLAKGGIYHTPRHRSVSHFHIIPRCEVRRGEVWKSITTSKRTYRDCGWWQVATYQESRRNLQHL